MFYNKIFKPTIQRRNTKKLIGFDIETYDKNKKFYCASLVSDDIEKIFYDKDSLVKYIKMPYFKNSFIMATNLAFDFMGIFYKHIDICKFLLQFRGSSLIFARTYSDGEEFHRKRINNRVKTVTFLDTMNYAALSVEKMGKILGLPKLTKPKSIGKFPTDKNEKDELIRYNIRDSRISFNFAKFLFKSFAELGSSPRLTIASTAMSIYKNKYLKNTYRRSEVSALLDQFKGYYGGRCEAFKRGEIRNLNYYDFNSLYPSVMLNEFPDPNTMRVCHKNDLSYIENYDGISDVEIYCPEIKIPFLPLRTADKLLFPYGRFRGWYSHIELKKARRLGYTIMKIYKTYYYKDNCLPFYDFVMDLYNKRMAYKKDNNPMEYVIKIIMNSLYGKFGQKFMNRDNWIPIPETLEELYKIEYDEMIGDYIRIKKEFTEPNNFCIPIWALYVTAYGRIKLYEILSTCDPYYCDTDSIITKEKYQDNKNIGKLKLEHKIKMGIIVRPKFYGFIDENNKEYVKIKGLGMQMNYDSFIKLLQNPSIRYEKFMKFKESLRRGYTPNEIQEIMKEFNLNDTKRLWKSTFSFRELQESQPLEVEDQRVKVISEI